MVGCTRRRAVVLALGWWTALTSSTENASAQSGPAPPFTPPATAPYAPAPSAAATPAPDDSVRVKDPHADRVLVLPTAYTHPAGSWFVTSYDIVLIQLGYALTDRSQITLSGTPPLGEDKIFPLDLSLKVRVVDDGAFKLAAVASVSGIVGMDQGNAFVGRAGGVAQFCLDGRCDGSLTLGSSMLLVGPAVLAFNGLGGIWPVADWLTLLFEADTLLPLGRQASNVNAFLAGGGVRFPWRHWAIDVGLTHLFSGGTDPGTLPILVVSYRGGL